MNEEDRKAFDEWFAGRPEHECHCGTCKAMSEKYWQASLKYERSSPYRQKIRQTVEKLRAENDSLGDELGRLKMEYEIIADAYGLCQCDGLTRKVASLKKIALRVIKVSRQRRLEIERLQGRIAELEADRQEPTSKRIFVGCDCEGWKNAWMVLYAQSRCPFCGKSLWKTR